MNHKQIIEWLTAAAEAPYIGTRSYYFRLIEEALPRLEFTGFYLMTLLKHDRARLNRILSEYGL